MRIQLTISPSTEEELIDDLNSISILSSRLARRLQAKKEPRLTRPVICPLLQERMNQHEAVRDKRRNTRAADAART